MSPAAVLSPEMLENLVERIFTKIESEYDRWLYFVLNKKKETSEEAHIHSVEEYIHPLYNLALTISLKGKMARKSDVDLAMQHQVSRHARALFSCWKASPAQVGKADAYKLLYQSRMMCALVNLMEEDTVLNTLLVRSPPLKTTTMPFPDLFLQGYQDRKLFLESREAEVSLRDDAVHYLSLKEGIARIVEQYEDTGTPIEHDRLMKEILSISPENKQLLEAAAQGYKSRLRGQQLALRLLSSPGELNLTYPTLRDRLCQNLELEKRTAVRLLQSVSFVADKPHDLQQQETFKELVEEAYSCLAQFAADPEDAQGKMTALSKFFIQLPYILSFPTKVLSTVFAQLSHEAEMELRRQEPVQVPGPKKFSFASLYTSPSYRTARMTFQSYQLVSLHLAEQPPSYDNHEVTRKILTMPIIELVTE